MRLFMVQINRVFFKAKDYEQVLQKLGTQIQSGSVWKEHARADVLITCVEEEGGKVAFHLEDAKPVPPAQRNKVGEYISTGGTDER